MPTDLPTALPPPGPERPEPYGLVGLVVSLILILVVAALLCLVAAGIGFAASVLLIGFHDTVDRFIDLDPSGGRSEAFRIKLTVVVSLVLYAATSGAVLLAAWFRGRKSWRDLVALRPWSPLRGTRFFWGLVVFVLVYSLLADAAIAHFYPKFEDMVHMPSGPVWVVLFVLLAAVFAPITEELVFRGWIYTSLRPRIGVPAGILVTAILFALAHWETTHLYALAVFPVGLALGFVRERTGSIKATMTFHAVYNAIASVLLFLAR